MNARAFMGAAGLSAALAVTQTEHARTTAPAGLPTTRATATLAVPGRANAHVSLASSGSDVIAVWAASVSGGATDIVAAVSRDGGLTFAAPVRVNATPGEARVNGEQPPRVAISATSSRPPRVTVIWTAKGATGTQLLTAQSDDLGKTFRRSEIVPGTDAPGNRGWQAIGADGSGRVHAVWLDHRRMAAPPADKNPAAHKHGEGSGASATASAASAPARPDGVSMAQRSDLYVHTFGDAAVPRAITPGVCYCCKTALGFGPRDEIFLAWRHVYPGNFRDIAFAASQDGGRTFSSPTRVSQDNWMLEGCPDDGPAMTVDPQGRVHVVWPAVVTDGGLPTKALFHAQTTDGRVFTPRQRIPTEGNANHPQMSVGLDGALRVAWDEAAAGKRTIVMGRGTVDRAGRVTLSRTPLVGALGVYPVVATTGAGALVAWTAGAPSESVIKVARVQ